MQFSQGAWFQLLLYQSKLEVCNKENKNQPHTHTSVEQAGCLGDVGKVLHFVRQRNTCYNTYPFKLYESVLRAFFPDFFSQGQGGMQRIKKCWERPQSLILPSLKFPTRSPRHRCRADPCNGNVFAIQSWSCVSKQTISVIMCINQIWPGIAAIAESTSTRWN